MTIDKTKILNAATKAQLAAMACNELAGALMAGAIDEQMLEHLPAPMAGVFDAFKDLETAFQALTDEVGKVANDQR